MLPRKVFLPDTHMVQVTRNVHYNSCKWDTFIRQKIQQNFLYSPALAWAPPQAPHMDTHSCFTHTGRAHTLLLTACRGRCKDRPLQYHPLGPHRSVQTSACTTMRMCQQALKPVLYCLQQAEEQGV